MTQNSNKRNQYCHFTIVNIRNLPISRQFLQMVNLLTNLCTIAIFQTYSVMLVFGRYDRFCQLIIEQLGSQCESTFSIDNLFISVRHKAQTSEINRFRLFVTCFSLYKSIFV